MTNTLSICHLDMTIYQYSTLCLWAVNLTIKSVQCRWKPYHHVPVNGTWWLLFSVSVSTSKGPLRWSSKCAARCWSMKKRMEKERKAHKGGRDIGRFEGRGAKVMMNRQSLGGKHKRQSYEAGRHVGLHPSGFWELVVQLCRTCV